MAATKLFQNDAVLKRRIVEKLKEFDAYIADELPAYILVMLDNKRQWSDISQELEVFLVESTEPFVEWLRKEIDPPKNEENAATKKTDPEEQAVEKKDSISPPDKRQSERSRAPQAAANSAPPAEKARSRSPLKEKTKNKERPSLQRYEAKGRQSDRTVSSTTHHSHSSHRKSSDHHRRSSSSRQHHDDSSSSRHHHDDSSSSRHHHDDSSSSRHHHDDNKKEKKEVESVPLSSTEKEPAQPSHKEPVDEDRIPIYAEQDEFRDENDRESDGSGSSREDARHLLTRSRKLTSKVVKVTRPKISTNSLLLKRAMEGVHPSALAAAAEKRKVVKPPPEVESERVESDKDDLRTVIVSHRSSKQKSERKRDVSDRHVTAEEEDVLPMKRVKQSLLFEEEDETERGAEGASTSKERAVKRPRLVMTETGLRTYKSLVKSGEIVDADLLVAQEKGGLQEGVLELPSKQEEEVVSPHPPERCKFWPQCKNGDRCSFHHPTIPCNMFPNCRFGAKCLFIHPQCKFDARCTRPNCPYLHTAPKQRHPPSPFSMFMPSAAIPIPTPMTYSGRGRGADKPRPHLDRSAFVWRPGSANKTTHISERLFATSGKSTAMPVSSNT